MCEEDQRKMVTLRRHLAKEYDETLQNFFIEAFPGKVEVLFEAKDYHESINDISYITLNLLVQSNVTSLKLSTNMSLEKSDVFLTEKSKEKIDYTVLRYTDWSHATSIKLLIEAFKGKALDVINNDGSTVLHLAAHYNAALVKLLIEEFLEKVESLLDVRDNNGNSMLHEAISNQESLQLLIDAFQEKVKDLLDLKNDLGNSLLNWAAVNNKDSLVLLSKKFPEIVENLLGMQNKYGCTAVHFAAYKNEESLKFLVDTFPDKVESLLGIKDQRGNTVLHLAARFHHPDSLKLLITKFPRTVKIKSLLHEQDIFHQTVLELLNSVNDQVIQHKAIRYRLLIA